MTMATTSRKAKILIVEDDEATALDLAGRLQRLRYHVVGVYDSRETALAAAEEERPDLLLMDVCLKRADVVDTAMAIRRSVDAPVIFLTAHSDPETLERVKRSNPAGYVLKPFQQRDLMVAIELAIHRHDMERQLRTTQRLYAATLASVVDAVVATDQYGRVTFMNSMAQALTGWTFEEAQMLQAEEVVALRDEASCAPLTTPATTAIATRAVVRSEARTLLVCRDGELVPVDFNASAIIDDDDHLLGAVMAFSDLRRQRESERALKRADDERQQSQRMETIGRLAAGVAHDFNNVLTVIGGDAELALSTEPLPDEVTDLLREMVDAVARGAALTRQLLVFSRKQQIELRVVDVNEFVYGIRHMLTRLLGETIMIDVRNDGSSALISIDLSQLEVIMLNLAANARDAMAQHGGTLSINTEHVVIDEHPSRPGLRAGRYVRITVADQGAGIDASIVPKIFEPFFTTKAVGQGTGLGLATVHSVVKRFGGHIYVESEAGIGTTFSIYFPPADGVSRAATVRERHDPIGTETILLVEDDAYVRRVAGSALRSRGYCVLESGGPSDALRIVASRGAPIDLVLSDVMLPEMDGPRMADAIRQAHPEMKVLYISGSPDEILASYGLDFEEVLSKPFTGTALANRVWDALHPARESGLDAA